MNYPEKLAALREHMRRHGLDAYLVPMADEYQNEYVPASAQRLHWLTGFAGSAGIAAITATRAALFTDGRYTIQAQRELPKKIWQPKITPTATIADWLSENLPEKSIVGYDPWLFTPAQLDTYGKSALRLSPVALNLIDAIWTDRPQPPMSKAEVQPVKLAGQSHSDKIKTIAQHLKKQGYAATILTATDSIAWLLNIRGNDVPYNPLCLAMAVVHADAAVDLYVDAAKIDADMRRHLGAAVTIRPPAALLDDLARLAQQKIVLDAQTVAQAIVDRLGAVGAVVAYAPDPCQMPKACKNKVEQAGMRAAHVRDGVAMAQFLHWLDMAALAKHTEATIKTVLEQYRAAQKNYRGESFGTIAGFNANGALVHYRADPKTAATLKRPGILLLDSGGQYVDGTTDITRTIAIGKPTVEQRRNYTSVLRGHIALSQAEFPVGTTGSQLDVLARQYLWQAGLDYAHGTGHGVGSYLCVHEGPQRISQIPNRVALQPGMVLSNEPGYYKTGAYGIRIENLIMVQPVKGRKDFLGFETLTLAPYDRALIDVKMLHANERTWVDNYHARVWQELSPLVDTKTKAWLKQACRKIVVSR
jgi:Xaa-Pro aminopeptidase